MRQLWPVLCLIVIASAFSALLDAQRLPFVLNPNTHEGKFAHTGIGLQIGFGLPLIGAELHREAPRTSGSDAAFRRVFSQTQSRFAFGLRADLQLGSDNDLLATLFGLEVTSISIGTASSTATTYQEDYFPAAFDPEDAVALDISESAMLLSAGVRFLFNFRKSEFIEADGRRTRDDWGLSLVVGPKVTLLTGSFEGINGLAGIGGDIGVVGDIPIKLTGKEDLFSVSPYFLLEINLRPGIDGGQVDDNPESPTFGGLYVNDNFDFPFWDRTGEDLDGDGLPDIHGIAIRRQDFVPAAQITLGATANLTPAFVSRTGVLSNSWRFTGGLGFSIPFGLPFGSSYPGDTFWQADEIPLHMVISFGASYFW
jgi:hypothetical protein